MAHNTFAKGEIFRGYLRRSYLHVRFMAKPRIRSSGKLCGWPHRLSSDVAMVASIAGGLILL